MDNIPVATALLAFVCAGRPKPKVRDKATGVQAMSNGRPVFLTELMALPADESSDERMQSLLVATAGEPPAVGRGDPVMVEGLMARQYDFTNDENERIKGVTFWADSITSLRGGQG